METLKGYVLECKANPTSLTDIEKANILIDENGHALLADFGLLAIMPDTTNIISSNSFSQAGTHRWMSPELLFPARFGLEHCLPTEPSDCYALGMVVYEVLSGTLPFHRLGHFAVVAMVLEGERPERPQGAEGAWFNDDIWSILGRCWKPTSSDRPKTTDVLVCLEKVSGSWSPSQTMNLDSSAKGNTDKSEGSSPSCATPPEPLSGLPPVGKPSIVPGIVGARKRQRVDIDTWEPYDCAVREGIVGKVCIFSWHAKMSLKSCQAISVDGEMGDQLQHPPEHLYKSYTNGLQMKSLQLSFFFLISQPDTPLQYPCIPCCF